MRQRDAVVFGQRVVFVDDGLVGFEAADIEVGVEAGLIAVVSSTSVTAMAPWLSLAMYFAAVAPPAPPPITTTRGLACRARRARRAPSRRSAQGSKP